jgi:type VI secretion system secreted protein Hcp
MAFDAFLQIDGIPGECTDSKHKDWIELTSFDHNMEQPASATASSSGGASAERVNVGPFKVTHLIDKASVKLLEACCTGKIMPKAVVHLCRAGGDKFIYAEITLKQLIISRVDYSGAAGAEFPSELIHITAGSYVWKYNQQDPKTGTGSGTISAGWDLTMNKTCQ